MSYKLFYSSVVLEMLSFLIFFKINSAVGLLSILSMHAVALFLLLVVTFPFLPKRFRKDKKKTLLALFLIIYPTLYIGYVSIVLYVLVVLRKQKNIEYKPYEAFSINDVLDEEVYFDGRKFGEASITTVGKLESANASVKERAVLSISDIKNPLTVSILKENLGSRFDDIRLYAFSVISKMEKSFNENLHKLKERLKDETLTDEDRARLYYEVASQYYEFIYYNIVDSEFREFMLEEVFYYAQKSLQIKETPDALILLGKFYLRKNLLEISYKYFTMATKYRNVNPVKYAPYIAEIYYKLGLYREIGEIFQKYPEIDLIVNPNLNFVASFWKGRK